MTDRETFTLPAAMDGRSYARWPITAYNFYLARQGSYDGDGRYSEVVGILTLHIAPITVEGKPYKSIQIYFRSVGSRRGRTAYGNEVISLEFDAEDMGAWISALNAPKKYLDIDDIDPKFLRIYLYAGSA
ncbi:MAG: hypothetical protein JNL82_18890 [Myxococcales bacterium]|nr:hypothetical protein [Myxococcales bacterium]